MRRIGKIIFFAGALSLVCSAGLQAQDTNEFQRIAKRIMDAYDVGEELDHKPDSSHVYGGAYLGASSNGRAMPSGYVTYLNDKLLLTSQLSVDFSELNTEKDVSTDFKSGADRLTSSNILTKYEKQDFSTRLDYQPVKGSIFTIGLLESLLWASGLLLTSFIWESLDLCLQVPGTQALLGSITTFVTVSLFQKRYHQHSPPSIPQPLLRCPLRAGVVRASV